MGKLTGLYQFPYGINASFTFVAREGYVLPTYVQVSMPRIGRRNLYGHTGGGGKFGDTRLPTFTDLNLRIEKSFKVGETTNVVLGADAFNFPEFQHDPGQSRPDHGYQLHEVSAHPQSQSVPVRSPGHLLSHSPHQLKAPSGFARKGLFYLLLGVIK